MSNFSWAARSPGASRTQATAVVRIMCDSFRGFLLRGRLGRTAADRAEIELDGRPGRLPALQHVRRPGQLDHDGARVRVDRPVDTGINYEPLRHLRTRPARVCPLEPPERDLDPDVEHAELPAVLLVRLCQLSGRIGLVQVEGTGRVLVAGEQGRDPLRADVPFLAYG